MNYKKYLQSLALIFCFVFPQSASAQLMECNNCIPGNFIVQFSSREAQQAFYQKNSRLAKSISSATHLSNLVPVSLIKAQGLTLTAFQGLFADNPDVVSISIDRMLETRALPNDPFFASKQWNLEMVKAPEAWDVTTGGRTQSGDDIVVAVCDDGFFINHEDLKDNLFVNKGEIPGNELDDDQNGYIDDINGANAVFKNGNHEVLSHGTGVMSIIGAKGNNEIGITGINWDVKLLPVSKAVATVATLLSAYDYIAGFRKRFNETDGAEGALIVATNLSAGLSNVFPDDYPEWCAMYDSLGKLGILSVGATVNSNKDVDALGDLPSTCESNYLIVTTSTNRSDVKAVDVGFGIKSVDLGAPGEKGFAADATGGYKDFSGTSCATPHVTGAIALLYSTPGIDLQHLYKSDPAYAALTVRNAILNNVDKVNSLQGMTVTGGRLNLARMISNYSSIRTRQTDSGILYPNPATDQVTYTNENLEGKVISEIRVTGLNGFSLPVDTSQHGNQIRLNVADLPPGIYFILIRAEDQLIYQKLIKH